MAIYFWTSKHIKTISNTNMNILQMNASVNFSLNFLGHKGHVYKPDKFTCVLRKMQHSMN